ncbi:MAG TPA: hypothetical protein VHT00_13130 [Stellaceae bacterium]|jgi:hypothetical protein|nr:hypothetical protein [Stellaceae bacterium]
MKRAGNLGGLCGGQSSSVLSFNVAVRSAIRASRATLNAPRAARQRPGFELDTAAAAATVQGLVEMSDPREEAPVSRRSLVSSG